MGADVAAEQPAARTDAILIVDDSPSNIVLLTEVLRHAGYTGIRGVTTPQDAISEFERWQPDIMLLDLQMPGVSGYDILEALVPRRSSSEYVPILVLTADATRPARRRALALGADDFLTKPFDLEETVLRVHNLLETRRLHRLLRAHNQDLDRLVAERTRALDAAVEELHRVAVEREALLRRVVTIQEEERRRIATALSRGSLQTMTAAALRADALEASMASSAAQEVGVLVREAIGQLREATVALHPAGLDREGLEAALRDALFGMVRSGAVARHDVRVQGPVDDVGEELRLTLFRVVQEALANVARHAQATSVTVEIEVGGDEIVATVRDDGTGFSGVVEATGGLGIRAMRERCESRGGSLHVASAPGSGTVVSAALPIRTNLVSLQGRVRQPNALVQD